jgi:hypothetical protein
MENGAKRMKGTNDIENGGEMEEGVELQCQQTLEIEVAVQTQTEQTECVEKGENSMADMRAMLLSIMEMLKEDKREREEDRHKTEEDRRKREEEKREMQTAINKMAMDLDHKINQRIEAKKDEVKIISERTHGPIQMSTETMQCSKSESNQAQRTRQSSFYTTNLVKCYARVCGF